MFIQEIYAAASPIYRSLKENPPRYLSVIRCSNWYPQSITIIKYSNVSHSTSSRTLNPHFASDVELCPCVNDVTANGVLNELTVYAQKLKYYSVDQRWSVCLFVCLSVCVSVCLCVCVSVIWCTLYLKQTHNVTPQWVALIKCKLMVRCLIMCCLKMWKLRRCILFWFVWPRPPSYPPPEMISLYESEYLDHPSHDNAKKVIKHHAW